jgi:hypothetical protein
MKIFRFHQENRIRARKFENIGSNRMEKCWEQPNEKRQNPAVFYSQSRLQDSDIARLPIRLSTGDLE